MYSKFLAQGNYYMVSPGIEPGTPRSLSQLVTVTPCRLHDELFQLLIAILLNLFCPNLDLVALFKSLKLFPRLLL